MMPACGCKPGRGSPIFDALIDAHASATDSWSAKAYWRGFSYSCVLRDALTAWDGTVVRKIDAYSWERAGVGEVTIDITPDLTKFYAGMEGDSESPYTLEDGDVWCCKSCYLLARGV